MISVIIPALNESRALPQTLAKLFEQRGEFEVILVDGASSDDTIEIAKQWPQVRITSSAPGRAKQMNAGAELARGEILLFLHADTWLPPGALARLGARATSVALLWGGFHQAFSGTTWDLKLISRIHNLRCQLTGVFYGDQAMFVGATLFRKANGFPDLELLEDIKLSEQLLALAKPQFLSAAVITDSRKFEKTGSLRSFLRCVLILVCNELRLPIMGKRFFAPIR
jgi:rSAM/selenodomain-associated transferase 2